ncbi:MAG: hypothetical protein ACE365_02710 [Gammaproteobacteria bacterium]
MKKFDFKKLLNTKIDFEKLKKFKDLDVKELFHHIKDTPVRKKFISFHQAGAYVSVGVFDTSNPINAKLKVFETQYLNDVSILKFIDIDNTNRHEFEARYILSADDYQLIPTDAPNVPEEELSQAAPWVVKDLIDIPLEEAAIDCFLVPVRKGQPAKCEVVVARKDDLMQQAKSIETLGVDLTFVSIEELALVNLLNDKADKAIGLLFATPKQIGFLIAKESLVHTVRYFNIGIQPSQYSDKSVNELIRALGETVDYYQMQFGGKIEQIFYLPSFENLSMITEALSQELPISVEQLDIQESLGKEFGKKVMQHGLVVLGDMLGMMTPKEHIKLSRENVT